MSSIHEEMSSEQKKRAKKMMGQLTQNPIAKSSGAGALSPEAAEQLGDLNEIVLVGMGQKRVQPVERNDEGIKKFSDAMMGHHALSAQLPVDLIETGMVTFDT